MRDCANCARRRLYGARVCVPTRVHPIILPRPSSSDIYLARGLTAGERKLDDGEFLGDVFCATVPEVSEWVRTGKITDVKTIIGTFWLEKVLSGIRPMAQPQ